MVFDIEVERINYFNTYTNMDTNYCNHHKNQLVPIIYTPPRYQNKLIIQMCSSLSADTNPK